MGPIAFEKQRSKTDCSVCCAAMALRQHYRVILNAAGGDGGWDGAKYDAVFEAFGFDIIAQPRLFDARQPAIFAVPSRLNEGGSHAVYYEAGRVYDPTTLARPYDLAGTLQNYAFLYQWNRESA